MACRRPLLFAILVWLAACRLGAPAWANGVSISLDDDLAFRVSGPHWTLGAERGVVAGSDVAGQATGRVQVVSRHGWLAAPQARFHPGQDWVDLGPSEGSWHYLMIQADKARLTGDVLDLDGARISTCNSSGHPDYTLRAARMQLVDMFGYVFVHASDVELSLFGLDIPLLKVPRVDMPLDRFIEQKRTRGIFVDQGWISPGIDLGGGVGLAVNTQYRFLHRPGAKGYVWGEYATVRQVNLQAVTELTDGSENLLLAIAGWQSPGPVVRTGPWALLRGIRRLGDSDRLEAIVSGRELLAGQIISRTPEVALLGDWKSLGFLDFRYGARAGEFLVENDKPYTRVSGRLELAPPPWRPWDGFTFQPMAEGVARGYLQEEPLFGGGVQVQAGQQLGDLFVMGRFRQRWAMGKNPLFYENYIPDQVVGGMVTWQIMPILRVGLFGEWSLARGMPVALDLMGSLVTDCAAVHVFASPLLGGLSVRGNLLSF